MPGIVLPQYNPTPQDPRQQAEDYFKKANLLPRPGDVYGPPIPTPVSPLQVHNPFENPSTTRAAQLALKRLGYDIGVDGIAGPQTMSAFKAYGNGIKPHAWVAANTRVRNQQKQLTSTLPGATRPSVAVHPPRSTKPTPTSTRTTASGTSSVDPYLAQMESDLIDPTAYAKSAADASYDPRINALVRQLAQEKADQKAQQGDIANWYAALVGQAKDSHTSDQAAYKDLIGASGDVSQGLINSLGGSASPAAALAAAQAQTGTDELAGLSLADLDAVNARKDSFAQQGVGQRLLSRKAYDAQRFSDFGSLADLRSAKGDEYIKDLQSAQGQRDTQLKNLMNAKITAALAGPQLKAATISNQTAQTQLAQARTNLKISQQNLNGQGGGTPDFEKQDPTKLSNYLLSGVLGARGNFNQNPVDIYNRMNSMLKTVSYGKYDSKSDPRVKQFLIGLVGAHLSAWNRQNPKNRYTIKGGRVVHI